VKPIRPNDAAVEEFRSCIRWYENESPGLGNRLWLEIQTAIDLIAEHPAIGETVRVRSKRSIRRLPLRHFPYLLIYCEHSDHLEVIALAHTSRKPKYWRSRLA